MINYLELPCIKASDVNIDDIPERCKHIKINSDLQIILTSLEDFTNAIDCLCYHMVKYLPHEIYDFITENRKICYETINSNNYDLFRNEMNVLIMTKPDHLIKRCAKHGLFNLLRYALKNKSVYPIPDKACNYAVGNTLEHFKCFTYLYENYNHVQKIMNKFTISHKMARKDVPICYLEYLHQHCCYLDKSCDNEFCEHTPWYTDCAETIVKNGDIKKLKYLHDMDLEFDENVSRVAIRYNKLSILNFIAENDLPFYEIKNHFT
jgi:hypothetical protein